MNSASKTEDIFQQEMEAYDALPQSVRLFIVNHKLNLPATDIYQKYEEMKFNEKQLWNWLNSARIVPE